MNYVVKKGNLYVAKEGHGNAYTNKLQYARKFSSREEAERDCCENECIVSIDSELGR